MEIQLTIAVNFISFKDNQEECVSIQKVITYKSLLMMKQMEF